VHSTHCFYLIINNTFIAKNLLKLISFFYQPSNLIKFILSKKLSKIEFYFFFLHIFYLLKIEYLLKID